MMSYILPEFVRSDYGKYDHDSGERPFLGLLGMKGYTETGVIGFPSRGRADKGRLVLDSLSRSFAKYFEVLE
jgi:creatinine amidohydrolase